MKYKVKKGRSVRETWLSGGENMIFITKDIGM
jgi:hypothetical protein